MNGIVFNLLADLVGRDFGNDTWDDLLDAAGASGSYTSLGSDDALARLRLEAEGRRAIEREEFRLVFRPIVSLDSSAIRGFEALVRRQHPARGLVSPPSSFRWPRRAGSFCR
jgi:hypothetical protein